jgi:hypothetical protein
MTTRQSKSVARIRTERRSKELCAICGSPSKKYRCEKCTPKKSEKEISEARRKAVIKRWEK